MGKYNLDIGREPRAEQVYSMLTNQHHPRLAYSAVHTEKGEVLIDRNWHLDATAATSSKMVELAADDLRRFFKESLGVTLSYSRNASVPTIRVVIDRKKGTVKGNSKREHVISVTPEGIEIAGISEWGAACGLYHLQRLLKMRKAPAVKPGEIRAYPALDPSITFLAFKTAGMVTLNYPQTYNKEYLYRIARAGYTGFHLTVTIEMFCRSRLLPEMNAAEADERLAELKEITELSRNYALDVYLDWYNLPVRNTHSVFKRYPGLKGSTIVNTKGINLLCSSHPLTKKFYMEQTERLFTKVPGLAGVFLLTGCEGVQHCYTAPGFRRPSTTNCPRCRRKDPENTVMNLINGMARSAKKVKPDALIAVWPYGADTWTKTRDARELVSLISPDCALMTNFDTDDSGSLEGVKFAYFDYSLKNIGPSKVFQTQAAIARRKGIKIMAKVENGTPREMVTVPSVPAMTRWAEKYHRIVLSGATGAMFNWQFVGYTESLSAELAAWMSWNPQPPAENLLRQMAARDFGKRNAEYVMKAWRFFDRAMEHFPFGQKTIGFFRGPFSIGFAQPLIMDAQNPGELSPSFFYRHPSMPVEYWDNLIIKGSPMFITDMSWTYPFGEKACLKSLKKMEFLWRKGCSELSKTTQTRDLYINGKLKEHRALCEGINCIIRTAVNMVQFYTVRDIYFREPTTLEKTRRRLTTLRNIAREELKNTEQGLKCMRDNILLGYDYVNHYGFTEEMVKSKIEHTRRLIYHDIPYRMFVHAHCMKTGRDQWIWDDGHKWR